jgi:hypothetical protein
VVSPNADAPLAELELAVFTPHESAHIQEWLCALELDTTADNPLSVWMHSRTEARIGRYAERLLEFYLTHGPVHRLAAAHVPLRSEVNGLKVTHGELDFLLTRSQNTSQGQRLHWELAVKFFVCTATGPAATPADFIGPNGVETLAHKWHKLFAKQLQRQTTHACPRHGMNTLGNPKPTPVAGCFTAGGMQCRSVMHCMPSTAKAGGQT